LCRPVQGENKNYKTRIAMQETFIPDEYICQQVWSLKLPPGDVEQELMKRGITTGQMPGYLEAIKKIRYAKRRSTGFICMAAGALLGFISCVLTISHALPHMYDFIMYGLTTIAVSIVVLGLYYVFE
jgi:hypothetical protein